MGSIKNCGVLNMKNKVLILEHGNMMYLSREVVQLKLPREINIMFYTILSLFICIFVIISTVKINDVVKVSGIVKTQTNNSTVSNIISGEIEQIFYCPNQYVEKGEILYSLRREVYETLIQDLDVEIKNTEDELFCVNTFLRCFNSGKNNIDEMVNPYVYSQLNNYFETVDYLEKQIDVLRHRYDVERNQPVALINQMNVDEAWMNYVLSQQELEKYKAGILAEINQKKKSYELNLEKLKQEEIRIKEEYVFLNMKAPVSGYVQEIASLNIGDYVFGNQEVLVIVPDDARNFRVELSIPTKDIGEITEGMRVKYRLSAFPFFEYHGAEGIIQAIDSDVRQSNNRLFYRVYSDIERTSFSNNKGVEYPLRAGIEVNARIILEKISVMHFILRKLDFMQ